MKIVSSSDFTYFHKFLQDKSTNTNDYSAHVNTFCLEMCVWNGKSERVLSETNEGFRRGYFRNAFKRVSSETFEAPERLS